MMVRAPDLICWAGPIPELALMKASGGGEVQAVAPACGAGRFCTCTATGRPGESTSQMAGTRSRRARCSTEALRCP